MTGLAQWTDNRPRVTRELPRNPPMRACRGLNKPAIVQRDGSSADHEPLHKKGIAQTEKRALVVMALHAVEDNGDRLPLAQREIVPRGLCGAQLGGRQDIIRWGQVFVHRVLLLRSGAVSRQRTTEWDVVR